MSLVLDTQGHGSQQHNFFPTPTRQKDTLCPICNAGVVTGLQLLPLSFEPLEKAIELKKTGSQPGVSFQGRKHGRDEMSDFYAEAAYLLHSNSRSSVSGTKIADHDQLRTGRWTSEEIAFVDFLVSSFDKGTLPLPHGIKLNEFLGDMLLCKSSRLTKKMKNAKLSTRSFALSRPTESSVHTDFAVLSGLQEKFLMSIPSTASQLELRFNLTKQWRTHFSNLCIQVGYQFLDAKEWIASLEELERRASCVEDNVRKVRRRQMGIALKTDGGAMANPNVFISGFKADSAFSQLQPYTSESASKRARTLSTSEHDADIQKADDLFPISFDNNALSVPRAATLPRSFSEDFDAVLDDLMEPEINPFKTEDEESKLSDSTSASNACGPFLDAVISYMESKDLPFQHIDVWIPSFLLRDGRTQKKAADSQQLRLFCAGHGTRRDIDHSSEFAMKEFGVYSEKFTFESGHGLPGRVYATGNPSWENRVDETDPNIFERAGGARVYGIRTAVGFPVNTPLVGRIVVVMYSGVNLDENPTLLRDCSTELVKLAPEPKWKIVIETNDGETGSSTTQVQPVSQVTTSFNKMQKASISDAKSEKDEEHLIVSLLGEHMPLEDGSPAGESSASSMKSAELLPHFMAMRLTLLRPRNRRSTRENEMIDILKYSYKAYSNDNRRSGSELATLLAKDWICLKASFGDDPNSTSAPEIPSMPMLAGTLPASAATQNSTTVDSVRYGDKPPIAQTIVSYDHSQSGQKPVIMDPLLVNSSSSDGAINPKVVTPNLITDNRDL